MILTGTRFPESEPLYNSSVTGPEAPSQVIVKGFPASTLKSVLVKATLASAEWASSIQAARGERHSRSCMFCVFFSLSSESFGATLGAGVTGAKGGVEFLIKLLSCLLA